MDYFNSCSKKVGKHALTYNKWPEINQIRVIRTEVGESHKTSNFDSLGAIDKSRVISKRYMVDKWIKRLFIVKRLIAHRIDEDT